jgi:hypothetical protein
MSVMPSICTLFEFVRWPFALIVAESPVGTPAPLVDTTPGARNARPKKLRPF